MEEKEKKIIDYFYALKKHGRIEASYLLAGKGGALLSDITKLINCPLEDYYCGSCESCSAVDKGVHPDILILSPEKTTIKIDSVRQAQSFLSFKSFQAGKRILIVDSAHCLTHDAASAFLKTLEEPPKECFIMLVSSRVDLILPAIVSRCRKIYLPYSRENSDAFQEEVADFLKNGSIYIDNRQSLSTFLLRLIGVLRDYAVFKIYEKTNKLINKNNYAIISPLNYTFENIGNRLDGALKIYTAVDNININLACNLLKLTFRGERAMEIKE